MIKKTVQYVDFNGDSQTEDIYFNLSKAELTEMEASYNNGLKSTIQKISEAKDNGALIAIFKNILTRSVGKRSEDGKRFIKNEQIIEEFVSSEAYSTLFMELAFNADAAVDFIAGVVPKDLINKEEILKAKSHA